MIELEDEIVEREVAFTDDWYMVRKMGRTPTFAEAIHWADTHPNWIKVEDRLPDDGQVCLIVTKPNVFCFKAKWSERLRVFLVDNTELGYYKSALTHWLPIVLPKED